jgi:hypothetical protein
MDVIKAEPDSKSDTQPLLSVDEDKLIDITQKVQPVTVSCPAVNMEVSVSSSFPPHPLLSLFLVLLIIKKTLM